MAYLNLGSFRRSNLTGHGTTAAGVVAAAHLYAGIATITSQLPVLPCKNFDNLLCFGIPQVPGADNGAATITQKSVISLGFGGTQPSPDALTASSHELCSETYYRLPVGHNTQFAGNPNHITGTEPVFAFRTSIRHGH